MFPYFNGTTFSVLVQEGSVQIPKLIAKLNTIFFFHTRFFYFISILFLFNLREDFKSSVIGFAKIEKFSVLFSFPENND